MDSNSSFCLKCHAADAPSCCSSCHEVCYCNKECQKADWKKHKACCKAVAANPMSVFLQVTEGEGNGLQNEVKNHVFTNKQEGLDFASKFFHRSMSRPFRSPFCELLGWNVEIYCSLRTNKLYPPGSFVVLLDGQRVKGINGAGVYLGCDLRTGLTKLNNIDGPIFVTGRNKAGEPFTSMCLWGILNFIWDCMDLYGEEEDPQPTIREWADEYKNRTWEPRGGDGGIDVYDTNPLRCDNSWRSSVKDHRLPPTGNRV